MTIPYSSGKNISIDQLTNVNITDIANNDLLQYNATTTEWTNGTLDLAGTDLSINNLDLTGTLSINGSNGDDGAYLVINEATNNPEWRRPYFIKVELETEDNTGVAEDTDYVIGVDGEARPLVPQFSSKFNYNNSNWSQSTSVWTCPFDGIYRINAQITFQSANDNDRIQFMVIEFYKDTSKEHISETHISAEGATDPDDFIEYSQSLNVLMEFTASQTFEMRLRFFRRGTGNMIIRADGKTFICIERVA